MARTRPPLIEALRARRQVLGISQEDLADRIGVDACLVRWWENSHRAPSAFMAQAWAQALGCRLVLLLVDAPPPGGVEPMPRTAGGGQKPARARPLDQGAYFCPPWCDR